MKLWPNANQQRSRQVVTFAYSTLLVVVMLHFPAAKFWLSLMNRGRTNDLPTSGLQASILIVHFPAVALLARRNALSTLVHTSWPLKIIFALLCFAGVSTIWSELPGQSFWDWSVIVSSVAGAIFMGIFLDVRRYLLAILVALQISVILSIWAVNRNWPSALQPDSTQWQGIFGNRNTLAPVAAFGVMVSVALFLLYLTGDRARRITSWVVFTPFIGVCLSTSTYALIKTKSLTSWAGLILALAFTVIAFVVPRFKTHRALRGTSAELVIWISALVSMVVGFALVGFFSGGISSHFERYGKLSGRFDYWQAGLEGIIERPLLGWGWNAAWLSEAFRVEVAPRNAPLNWSHSVWLDFGLGMGVIGFILGLAWVVLLIKQASRAAVADSKMIAILAISGFVLVVMSMESMSWIFHWFFALVVGGSILAARTLTE
jgi:exopolysaccharide production protein ExoQ